MVELETTTGERRPESDLRVCFISPPAYTYFESHADIAPGGAERQLHLLARELQSRFDVHFVVGDYGQAKTEVHDGIVLHRSYKPDATFSFRKRISQLWKLFGAMHRADADVYVYRGHRSKAVVTWLFAKLLSAKWVFNVSIDSHAEPDLESSFSPLTYVYRKVLSAADHVVVQSEVQKRRLLESCAVDSTVVHNGYPPKEELSTHEDREFFLFVGRIDREQKRPHLFLRVAEELPEESFVLIGPPDNDETYYETIREQAHQLDNVTFLGQVDPDDIHTYFDRALALINTSSEEGFPNTLLEAWRSGTPVVSLDVNPSRFIEDDLYGFAEGNFDELVVLARNLADSPDVRQSVGNRSRQKFEENFRISAVAEQYASVLRSCVEA